MPEERITPEFEPNHPPNVVLIFIKNELGEYFIHQRKDTKRVNASMWGIGVGGYIEENETASEAAYIEFNEETGYQMPETSIQYMFDTHYNDEKKSYNISVFIAEVKSSEFQPENIPIEKREWDQAGFTTQEDIRLLSEDGQLAPDTAYVYNIFVKQSL